MLTIDLLSPWMIPAIIMVIAIAISFHIRPDPEDTLDMFGAALSLIAFLIGLVLALIVSVLILVFA